MSKTDKTRPYEVQAMDRLVELHDHTLGGCDLPTVDEWLHMSNRARYARGSCTYQPRNWATFHAFTRYKGEGEEIKRVRNRKVRPSRQEILDQINDDYEALMESLAELDYYYNEMEGYY